MKNILFTCILLLISSNTAFSQCEQHIFSLGKKSMYSGESLLSVLCTSTSKSDVEWRVVDSMYKVLYTKCYDRFQEMVQFETHFSNVLDNSASREFATISLKDEKTGKILHSDILSIEFYYEYQADSLISAFNKYRIKSYGSPQVEEGSLMVLKNTYTILIFLGDLDLEDKDLEKIYLYFKKILTEG